MRDKPTMTGVRLLATLWFVMSCLLLIAHGAAAATNPWILISTSETDTAVPNWSPPNQGSSSNPVPALGDLDGDGKLDLLIGHRDGTIAAYRDSGTATDPAWTAVSSWGLSSLCTITGGNNPQQSAAPALVDLNGDNKLDLVVGTRDGVCVYQNTGSVNVPAWTENSTWQSSLGGLATNKFYSVALADLDGDHLVDMMLFTATGVFGYRNTGSSTSPDWTAEPAWDRFYNYGGESGALSDIDGDGLVDMATTNGYGDVQIFKNTGTNTAPQWTSAGAWYPPITESTTVIPSVAVALGDLNGDNKPDLLYSTFNINPVDNLGPTAVYEQDPAGLPPPGFSSNPPPAVGSTVTDTFDSFSCGGAWVPAETGSTQGVAGTYQDYTKDCGNGWTAYAEDVSNPALTPYRYSPGPIGDQNVTVLDDTVNGPSAASSTALGAAELQTAPDNSVRGVLWLLKSFPVTPGVTIQTLKADIRVWMNSSTRTRFGLVVFDGIVANPSGPTGPSGVPLSDNELDSDIVLDGPGFCGTSPWCPWQTVDFGGLITPTHAYITVAFRVEDTSTAYNAAIEADNLTVGNVVNVSADAVTTGDIAQLWKQDYVPGGTNIGGQSTNGADPVAVATDADGNVYVAGNEDNGSNHDIVTIKYDAAGNQLWTSAYDGGDTDKAVALAVDGSGNVYVTGHSYLTNPNNSITSDDYVVIKYDSSGAQQWTPSCVTNTACFNNADRNDQPAGMVVDGSGNVYVTGSSCGASDCVYATVEFGSAGTEQWHAMYDNGGASTMSTAVGIVLDGTGKVYVSGTSRGGTDDIVTIKYDSAGSQLRLNRYDSGSMDRAIAMATDSAGAVYVTGVNYKSGSPQMVTLKYAATAVNGDAPQWVKSYSANSESVPAALAVDGSGNVYVTGIAGTAGAFDFMTIKYLNNGDVAWAQTFGDTGLDDHASGIAVDGAGNVYVVGSVARSTGNTDFAVVKYDSSGVARNEITYDGYSNTDTPLGIVLGVDAQGDTVPVVTGASDDGTGRHHIATLRYEKALPDLTMTQLSGPASGVVSGTIDVANTVYNISDLANKIYAYPGAFEVSLYLAPDVGGTPDLLHLIPLATRSVSDLAPGISNAATTTVTIPATTVAGNYYVVARADSGGAVIEADEANNQMVSSSTITIAESDLVVSTLDAPTSVTRDVSFDVTTTITNLVASPTPSTTSFRVGIYLSTDPTITTADTLIGSRTISSLAGFGSDTATTSVTIPSSTVAAGNYYIGAIADDQDTVIEANETNNSAVLQAPAGNSVLLTTDTDFSPGLSVAGTTNAAVVGTGTAASVQLAIDTSATSVAWLVHPAWAVPGMTGQGIGFALGDLDGDGLPDLMAGSTNGSSQVFAYQNTGSASAPVWTRNSAWDIGTSIQCGGKIINILVTQYSMPKLVDLNGDGVLDLVVGSRDAMCIYINNGSAASPAWARADGSNGNPNWESGLPPVATNQYFAPAAADLDGDGLVDLMIGTSGGIALGYKNTGTATGPAWTATAAWDSPNISGSVNPELADLDGDGTYDLLLGKNTGGILYAYQNTGTAGSPGSPGTPVWATMALWALNFSSNASTAPALGKLDSDGRIDLLVGSNGGNKAYDNIQAYATPATYLSAVLDAGVHGGYTTLSYVAAGLSTNTTLTVDIRAGDAADTTDPSWTPWVTGVVSDGDISALGTHRYVQYRANLASLDPTMTPELDSIEANKLPPGPQYSVVSVSGGGGSGGGALGIPDLLLLAVFTLFGRRGMRRWREVRS